MRSSTASTCLCHVGPSNRQLQPNVDRRAPVNTGQSHGLNALGAGTQLWLIACGMQPQFGCVDVLGGSRCWGWARTGQWCGNML